MEKISEKVSIFKIMNNKNIWIVYGESGEYSDHMEWPVCAYYSEKKAEEHAKNAQATANQLQRKYHGYVHKIPMNSNPYDSRAPSHNTSYGHYMVEIKDEYEGSQYSLEEL